MAEEVHLQRTQIIAILSAILATGAVAGQDRSAGVNSTLKMFREIQKKLLDEGVSPP